MKALGKQSIKAVVVTCVILIVFATAYANTQYITHPGSNVTISTANSSTLPVLAYTSIAQDNGTLADVRSRLWKTGPIPFECIGRFRTKCQNGGTCSWVNHYVSSEVGSEPPNWYITSLHVFAIVGYATSPNYFTSNDAYATTASLYWWKGQDQTNIQQNYPVCNT